MFQTVPDKLNEKSFWLTVKDGMLDASDLAGATGDTVDNPENLTQFSFVLSQFAQKKPTGG